MQQKNWAGQTESSPHAQPFHRDEQLIPAPLKDQEGQWLCFCLHTFVLSKEIKGRNPALGFQLLDPGASDRVQGLPDAVVRYLLNLSARTH